MAKPSYVPESGAFARNTLNILWFIFTVITIGQLVLYPLISSNNESLTFRNYFFDNYVTVNIFLLIINLALEAVLRLKKSISEPSMIVGVHLFTAVIVTARIEHAHIAAIVTMLPVMLSTYYLKREYIFGSFLINVIGNLLILAINGVYDFYHVSLFVCVVALSAGFMFVGFGIMRRGIELINSLEKSMESEQEYMIKNIVMDRMSKMDPLTDLYNHKTFHEYFDRLIDHHGQLTFPLHLAVLDIDNFKKVNDTYGHAVGDIALKMVADRIKQHTGSDDFAARYGGEEFVVLLTTVDEEGAYRTLETLRESIASTPIPEMDNICVTVSIGLHTYRSGDTKSVSFQRADQALYEAKGTGKNKTVVR